MESKKNNNKYHINIITWSNPKKKEGYYESKFNYYFIVTGDNGSDFCGDTCIGNLFSDLVHKGIENISK